MTYDVPLSLPKTPATIQQVQAFANEHNTTLEEVCGGIVAKALNRANIILKDLAATVLFDRQLKMPSCVGTTLSINPIIDGEKDKGRMILFKVQMGPEILNIGALSIMDKARDGENIEGVEILANRIALAALSHMAVKKIGVADLGGLRMDLEDKNLCQIGCDGEYLTINGARVVIDFSTTDQPEYVMLRTAQIAASLPQHFVKFDELSVIMIHDSEITEAALKEEFYFSCLRFNADSENFRDPKTAEEYSGEYVKFFRLDAPAHVALKGWEGDIARLKELRRERIENKADWEKSYDVDLYPKEGLRGIQLQIKRLKKEF